MTLDIMHDEERRTEIADVEAAKRNERIGVLTKEYIEDVGAFFEFIQGIEIGDSDTFSRLHEKIVGGHTGEAWRIMNSLFESYCEEKAIKEIDE